jgi:transglutaminase-like putative cysteine protease
MRRDGSTAGMACGLALAIMSALPVSAAPPPFLRFLEALPIVDTLEVLLQGIPAGTLVASLARQRDITENSIALRVEMADQAGGGSHYLELEERRKYLPSGRLVSAFQRMSGVSGVNSWELTADTSGPAHIVVTAAGETTRRDIGKVHESMATLAEMYAGVLAGSLHAGDRWTDTAIELTSGDAVITETRCDELPARQNGECWVFTCTNSLLQRPERWKLDRRGKTVYRDLYPYTARKKGAGSNAAVKDSGPHRKGSLFDMMKISAARPVDAGREQIAVELGNDQLMDTSVAALYLQDGASYILRDVPRQCNGGSRVSLAEGERARFLLPTATLQCDHPAIRRVADSLFIAGRSACDLVGRYNHWVYTALEKKNTPTFSSALDTLENRYGDCGEHAVLLAALLRASGIPARIVEGLVYVAAEQGYYYHAWVMAYAGGWIFADPSHDSFPAWRDRVPLVFDDDGTRLTALARVIGRVSVRYVTRRDDRR